MLDHLLHVLLSLTLLVAIFVPLERAFRARPQGHLREQLRLDFLYFGLQYFVMVFVYVELHGWFQTHFQAFGPAALVLPVRRLPGFLQAVIVFALADFCQYWGHRLSHRVPLLWRFHGVHHTSTRLDWVAAHREHPFDGLYSFTLLSLPVLFFGVDTYLLAPWFVFRGMWAIFVHSNIRMELGPLGILFGDPVLHRWHHARTDCTHNYANLAPYWDLLFGTHHRPADEAYALGMQGEFPGSFATQLIPGLALLRAKPTVPHGASPGDPDGRSDADQEGLHADLVPGPGDRRDDVPRRDRPAEDGARAGRYQRSDSDQHLPHPARGPGALPQGARPLHGQLPGPAA